jgi:lipoic acid synthetase
MSHVSNPDTAYQRKPEWIRTRMRATPEFGDVRRLMRSQRLNTVCEEARCPNIHECWGTHRTATFMILGSVCTRRCRFCSVATGLPTELDLEEPQRLAATVAEMELRHVVVTMVTRDDLRDGGAGVVADTVAAIRAHSDCSVELLTSDFGGDSAALARVLGSRPEILAHNVETVARLTPMVRSNSSYDRSLEFLRRAAQTGSVLIKSSIMVGLGESNVEVEQTLGDLRSAGVEIVNIGQYLQPTKSQQAVVRYWPPAEFAALQGVAASLGFLHCEAGPFVRSSYHAGEQLQTLLDRRQPLPVN